MRGIAKSTIIRSDFVYVRAELRTIITATNAASAAGARRFSATRP